MIVPRTFPRQRNDLNEKTAFRRKSTRADSPSNTNWASSAATLPSPVEVLEKSDKQSEPVQIPKSPKRVSQTWRRPASTLLQQSHADRCENPYGRRESAHDMLSATVIPVRKNTKTRHSQRLPQCNYVADFTRLLMDDMSSEDGTVPVSKFGGAGYFDGLFGSVDGFMDGQMIVGSQGIDESVLSVRSGSSTSLASPASPNDYGSSGVTSPRESLARSLQEKRSRQLANSEDCVSNHPLLSPAAEEPPEVGSAVPESPVPPSTSRSAASTEKRPRSFKSSLTASLKAIKETAQSVSSRAGALALSGTDDYLARSFFDFHPSLTDDKRPPPSRGTPPAALRRYLNPPHNVAPDSPAQLHFWHDDSSFSRLTPKGKKSKQRRKGQQQPRSPTNTRLDSLPRVVQLADCLPPSVRTAHASSPPIWLAPDGTPANRQTALPLLLDPELPLEAGQTFPRNREPRENRHFLRVFVCEMEMRRHGKLSDDVTAGRAKLWLPPVGENFRGKPMTATTAVMGTNTGAGTGAAAGIRPELSRSIPDRWVSHSVGDGDDDDDDFTKSSKKVL